MDREKREGVNLTVSFTRKGSVRAAGLSVTRQKKKNHHVSPEAHSC